MFTGTCTWFSCRERRPRPSPRAVYSSSSSHSSSVLKVPVVLQKTAKKCTKIQNASAQLLFCSLILLFGVAAVAIAVVVC